MDTTKLTVRMERETAKKLPVNLQFTNLTYKTMENKKNSKIILNGVSGEFRTGELSAIMGPSGCGKSTLLNLLAGYRTNPSSGNFYVNNLPLKRKEFKRTCRYVLQDDQLCPYFTVEETLTFAANFKLDAAAYTKESRHNLILTILDIFQLRAKANTMISKISGGERKRVSIALEILDQPAVLLLDEPTTGLDEFSAMQCVRQLKNMAQSGRTVVCSIHSPSAKIMEMFDNIYVMAQGQCIYHGAASHIVPYLQRFQLNCPVTYNPADFIVEVATFEYGNYHKDLVHEIDNGKICKWLPDSENCKLVRLDFSHTALDRTNELSLLQSHEDAIGARTVVSWWFQYKCLFKHNITQIIRDRAHLYLRVIAHLFINILMGWTFLGIGNNGLHAGLNYNYCLLTAIACIFITMTPMFSYVPQEIQYLRRQHFNGWYHLEPYFLALHTAQLPMVLIMSIICSVVLYPLNGLPMELFRFALFSGIIFLTTLVGTSYGVLVGSRYRLLNALFMGPNVIAVLTMFANQGVDKTYLSILDHIIIYSSFVRHSLEGFLASMLKFNRSDLLCPPTEIFCMLSKPSVLMKYIGCNNLDYLRSVVCLIAFYLFFVAAAYVTLRSRLSRSLSLAKNPLYVSLCKTMTGK